MSTSFRDSLRFAMVLFFLTANAQAQRMGEAAYSQPQQRSPIESLSNLLASAQSPSDRFKVIESLYDKTIKASDENVSLLERLADKGDSPEERVAAIRVYGLLYSPVATEATNERIRAKLRALAQDMQKDVATAAVLRYSRLPYSDDVESLLDLNYSRGYLSNDDIQGELAHIFPFVPKQRQSHLLSRLDKENNEYALDILASSMKQKSMRSRLSTQTRAQLIGVLQTHQPGFSAAIGEFSLKEAIVFSDWLHALANLKAEASLDSYENVVLAYIDGPTANPKRAISFFASVEGKAAATKIGYTRLKPIFDRIAIYSDGLPYPQHSALRDFSLSAIALKNQIRP